MTDYAGYLSGGNNEFAVCTAIFADNAPDIEVIELNQSTATVALAAAAHRVEPGQIAKTLSLKVKNEVILVVAKGTLVWITKIERHVWREGAHAQ